MRQPLVQHVGVVAVVGAVAALLSGPAAAVVTAGAALALAGLSEAAADADRFWSSPPLPPRPAVLPVATDLLLRQLPPPGPALGGDALVRRLGAAYEKFATASQ